MASELRQFTATIPAGTAIAAPATVSLAMPPRIVRRVRARIPPGPNGLFGWALASGGVPVIPWNAGAWIVGSDEYLAWDLQGQIESGAWELRGYNTGAYDHAVYLVFELDPPQLAGAELPGPGFLGIIAGPSVGFEPSPAEIPPPAEAPPPPAPAGIDGYAIARRNAIAAVQAATGGPVTVTRTAPPRAGTVAATAYDAGRQAAIAAVRAIGPAR